MAQTRTNPTNDITSLDQYESLNIPYKPLQNNNEPLLTTAALLTVLRGVAVATRASDSHKLPLSDWLTESHSNTTTAAHTVAQWRSLFVQDFDECDVELKQLAEVTLAVALLREHARGGTDVDAAKLDTIWSMLHHAIEANCGLQFSATRSAQGFLVVPLCSLLKDGTIEELWRLHVWLPDEERGVSDVVIHAHQPFAQSWILAGCGTDHTLQVESCKSAERASHATYDCCYMDSKGTSSGYKTHQMSSTVTNTGKFVNVSLGNSEVHTRDMTYIVPAGTYHESVVSGNRLHATLFVFDAHRGFDQNAAVLGPVDGTSYTQLRDPAGLTAQALAKIADAARRWEQAHDMRSTKDEEHPTVLGYYKYFRGLALLRNGQQQDAMQYFNSASEPTPLQAFAQDPSVLHRSYMQTLIEHGADLDIFDSGGYTALDYAILKQDHDAEALILEGHRKRSGERKATRRGYEATVRRDYRELFQEQLRPILAQGRPDALEKMQYTYAAILETDQRMAQMFDVVRWVSYSDFCKSGRLPRFTDDTMRTFSSNEQSNPKHIIYVAYRWIHKDPATGKTANDDKEHTQYRRMLLALEEYLAEHPKVDKSTLGIWVDSVAVNRKNPLPGIAALPMHLAQCNTLITIEDDHYWARAWCCVEALMIQILRRTYGRHEWYRYSEAHEKNNGKGGWKLVEGAIDEEITMSGKTMTWEEDRDVITFLERQARLL